MNILLKQVNQVSDCESFHGQNRQKVKHLFEPVVLKSFHHGRINRKDTKIYIYFKVRLQCLC